MRLFAIIFTSLIALTNTVFATPLGSNSLLENEKNNIQIFKQLSSLVVNVYRVEQLPAEIEGQYLRAGAGSGFFWDTDGHIVTNYHVVQNAKTIMISPGGGKVLPAKLVGADPRKDIALLQVELNNPQKALAGIPKLILADSDALLVGQKAIAIGNPYGLDRTLTTGVVSALGRRVTGIGDLSLYDMVQTDASINPGNSGGPLLDSSGHLIGMNTLIFSRTGTSSGIGFAVPSNAIKRVVTQIIEHGEVIHQGFGIQVMDQRISVQLGAPGLIIARVYTNSPAEKVGLRGTYRTEIGEIIFGDVITHLNKQRVRNLSDYYEVLDKVPPGELVELQYLRDGKLHKVKLATVAVSELH